MNREVIHYNLQMIIAVGFKVNNDRAVRFRKWFRASRQRLHYSRLDNGQGTAEKRHFVMRI